MVTCDVLIIGSGVAGLSLAIKLIKQFPDKNIYVITKGSALESNTRHAKGGISVVCDHSNDSFEQHIEDTIKAGSGLCNIDVVERVVRYGQKALLDLKENGVVMDCNANGKYSLGKEGGHSRSRIVHHKDMTGLEIAVSLLVKARLARGITLLDDHTAIDFITSKDLPASKDKTQKCYGAFVLNEKTRKIEKFISAVTVLATGGIGQVYETNTNPKIATGDGIAMAYRSGASIGNMEFIQFHPTAFYSPNPESPSFLISEALRGHGAYLRNVRGERFMFKYDPQGELACRDVVSRAIEIEISVTGHPCVFIDCTHLPADSLSQEFPGITSYCASRGIDITIERIPICPAAHYLCGGINVDLAGKTTIDNLYALGECANTGLHGANRLASNSLLEALAFSEFCFREIEGTIQAVSIDAPAANINVPFSVAAAVTPQISLIKAELQKLMTTHVGICRTTKGLQHAMNYIDQKDRFLREYYGASVSKELIELRNIIITAKLIISQSLKRKVNRGAFYNQDLDTDLAPTSTLTREKVFFDLTTS